MLQERFLQAVERRGRVSQSFDGSYFCALKLSDGDQARTGGFPIDQHGASSAVSRIASYLRPGQSQFLTQDLR
jgi:hypothetical protein